MVFNGSNKGNQNGIGTGERIFHEKVLKKMDIKKVDLLLKYILPAAGQEDFGNQEVGPIHLIKYVYLADLAFAERHRGGTFAGAL